MLGLPSLPNSPRSTRFVINCPAATMRFGSSASARSQALFDRWNESLRTLDADKVVANYAPDGVLLPTVSNTPMPPGTWLTIPAAIAIA